MTAPQTFSRLTLGVAPDSWGVWFPEDPRQVTWRQYLDELPKAGFVWTELGPQGFLPQDPQRLRDEIDQRGLRVCGGTVFAGLHRGKEALDKAVEDFGREARLLNAVAGSTTSTSRSTSSRSTRTSAGVSRRRSCRWRKRSRWA